MKYSIISMALLFNTISAMENAQESANNKSVTIHLCKEFLHGLKNWRNDYESPLAETHPLLHTHKIKYAESCYSCGRASAPVCIGVLIVGGSLGVANLVYHLMSLLK